MPEYLVASQQGLPYPGAYRGLFFESPGQRLLLAALALFLVGFWDLSAGIALSAVLAVFLVLRARPDAVLPLLLLYFAADEIGDFSSVLEYVADELAERTRPALDVQVVVNLLLPVPVFLELWKRPQTFRGKVPASHFALWFLALGFAAAATAWGRIEGYSSWTRGMRFVLMAGAYFYGVILSRRWSEREEEGLVSGLTLFTVTLLVLTGCRFALSFLTFLLTGLAIMLAFHHARGGKKRSPAALAALGGALLLTVRDASFTIWIIVLLALLFGALTSVRSAFLRKRLFKCVGWGILLSIWIFIVSITVFGDRFDAATTYTGGEDMPLSQKLEEKIFVDRMLFWVSAYNQIASGPYLVVPSGRPIELYRDGKEWLHGAHNTILELLRNTGLVCGPAVLFLLFSFLNNCLTVLRCTARPLPLILAGTALSVGIAGITTGDYPLDSRIGFWIWALAGLAYGLYCNERGTPAAAPQVKRRRPPTARKTTGEAS